MFNILGVLILCFEGMVVRKTIRQGLAVVAAVLGLLAGGFWYQSAIGQEALFAAASVDSQAYKDVLFLSMKMNTFSAIFSSLSAAIVAVSVLLDD